MQLRRFDRSDFRATQVLLVLLSVSTIAFELVVPLVRWVRGAPLRTTVDADGSHPLGDVVARAGAAVRSDGTLRVRLEDASTGTWLATLLPGLVIAVGVGVACVLLLLLIRRIEAGSPFVVASTRTFRALGILSFSGGLLLSLSQAHADSVVIDRAVAEGVAGGFTVGFPFTPFLVALLLLALAEVFERGEQLQADVEGLV